MCVIRIYIYIYVQVYIYIHKHICIGFIRACVFFSEDL